VREMEAQFHITHTTIQVEVEALQRRSPIWKILLRDRCSYRRCCKSMFPSTIGHCPDCLSQ
jgi:hypothetical protein